MRSLLLGVFIIFTLLGCQTERFTRESFLKELSEKSGMPLRSSIPSPLVLASLEWFGVSYKWGGNNKLGVDCSGLVSEIYHSYYKTLIPRTTAGMLTIGKEIRRRKAKGGDLVFFKMDKKTVNHVGLMLDSNHFLHASSSKGVRIDALDQDYYEQRFHMIIRINKTQKG
jgi:lipoprotein Spr